MSTQDLVLVFGGLAGALGLKQGWDVLKEFLKSKAKANKECSDKIDKMSKEIAQKDIHIARLEERILINAKNKIKGH